jgi:hypothetical protein
MKHYQNSCDTINVGTHQSHGCRGFQLGVTQVQSLVINRRNQYAAKEGHQAIYKVLISCARDLAM